MGEEERNNMDGMNDLNAGSTGSTGGQSFSEQNIVDTSAEVVEESVQQNAAAGGADEAPKYTYESAGNVNQNSTYSYSSQSAGGGFGSGASYAGSQNTGSAGSTAGNSASYAGSGYNTGNYQYSASNHEYYKGDSYGGSAGSGGSGSGGNGKGKGILAIVLVAIFGLCIGTGIWGVRHYLGSSTASSNLIGSAAEQQEAEVTGESSEPEAETAQAQDSQQANEAQPQDQQQADRAQQQDDQQADQAQDSQQADQAQNAQQADQTQQKEPAQTEEKTEVSERVINEAGLVISNEQTPETPLTKVVSKVMPSIVSVFNSYTEQVQSFYGQTFTRQGEAAGSGIIIGMTDNELLVVTNNHVVEGADGLKVQFVNEQTAEAEIKGTDASNDLAVIAVQLSGLDQDTRNAITVATLGDSDNLKIGEEAIAIGNALGYGQSVTTGIVSAKDREISDETITGTFIQTDAAINPGNSGGALVNINGDVIGINSSKIGGSTIEGMGFAIPISRAIPIIENLMSMETKTKVDESQQGVIGISGATVTSGVANAYNMPVGVYVAQIFEGSGAAASELREGDIITAINGQSVTSMEDLQKQLEYYAAGTEVTLTVQRQDGNGGYAQKDIQLTLSTRDTLENEQNTEQNEEGAPGQNGQNGGEEQFDEEQQSGRGGQFGQQEQEDEGESQQPGGFFDFGF